MRHCHHYYDSFEAFCEATGQTFPSELRALIRSIEQASYCHPRGATPADRKRRQRRLGFFIKLYAKYLHQRPARMSEATRTPCTPASSPSATPSPSPTSAATHMAPSASHPQLRAEAPASDTPIGNNCHGRAGPTYLAAD